MTGARNLKGHVRVASRSNAPALGLGRAWIASYRKHEAQPALGTQRPSVTGLTGRYYLRYSVRGGAQVSAHSTKLCDAYIADASWPPTKAPT